MIIKDEKWSGNEIQSGHNTVAFFTWAKENWNIDIQSGGSTMACCGRGRIGRVKRVGAVPRPRTAAPVVGKRDVSAAISELCNTIAEKGDSLTVKFIKGVLTIPQDGTSFELFSAIKSQNCTTGAEWAPALEKRWNRMTVLGRMALIKKLGKTEVTIREILNALG